MNPDYPPLRLPPPQFARRRPQKPSRQPLLPELLARRAEIARVLGAQVASLSATLKQMSEEERRAAFYKIEHEQPVNVSGTGLKEIARPTRNVTLAAPREGDLDRFEQKIEEFGTGPESQGHVKHEDYAYITRIAPGEPTDRLSDGLFAQYERLCQEKQLTCEIELLTLETGKNKQRVALQELIADLESTLARGVHGNVYEHEFGKGSCRVVVRLTGAMFRKLVEERKWQMAISWFEEKPRFQTLHEVWRDFAVAQLGPIEPPELDAPVVCVVDSGVSPGNPFLAEATREDLLVSFLNSDPENPFDEFGHGSGVASLAAYGALNLAEGATNTARVWVAGARILNAENKLDEERLFSRQLQEVVEHFEPKGVRIFVLAIGNESLPWSQSSRRTVPRTSWVARKIDQLSREHDVVFVTCTGNLSTPSIRELQADGRAYPAYLADEEARILDPGQASLAITVGSVAPSTLVVGREGMTALAAVDEPSPFTRRGPGIESETKPEVVEYGGNLVASAAGELVRNNLGTDVAMASHQLSPAATHSQGTSYAAPRAAHKLALLLEELQELGVEPVGAELLKALFVNSATYRLGESELDALREATAEGDNKCWLHLLGYGMADATRATFCDDYGTVLFYQGEIAPDTVAFFDVPVVESLKNSSGEKRITVTVVHSPEVQRWGLERYFGSDLKWRMFRGNIDQDQVVQAMSADDEAVDDDVELPNEIPFQHRLNRRSRGAVQHDYHTWIRHNAAYSVKPYTLAIACHKRWSTKVEDVPFAVVVRIEDAERTSEIYAETASILAEIEVETRSSSL